MPGNSATIELVGFGALSHHLVSQDVGVNQEAAHFAEGSADKGFAAGESASEAYTKHRRFLNSTKAALFSAKPT